MSKYIAKYEKQPSEVLPYVYTPQDDLESGDTISTATLTIVDAATGATSVSPGLNAATVVTGVVSGEQVVVMKLREGVSGASYKCTVKVVTTLGYTYEDDFLVKVKEK